MTDFFFGSAYIPKAVQTGLGRQTDNPLPLTVRGERRGEGKTMFPNSFPATGWLLRADLRAAKNKDDECWRSKVVHDIWGM